MSVKSYNQIINKLGKFATVHQQIERFTHGQLDLTNPDKFQKFPWMHAIPTGLVLQKGSALFSFQIWFMDLPRDREMKSEYQTEVMSDMAQIAGDLVYEIENGQNLFGEEIGINGTPNILFEIQEFTHVLSGCQLNLTIDVPNTWDACNIPADL